MKVTNLTVNRPALALGAVLAVIAGCTPTPIEVMSAPVPATVPMLAPLARPQVAAPSAVHMRESVGARVDSIITRALADRVAPGASVVVGRHGRIVHARSFGTLDWAPGSPVVTDSTPFDLASLTKVVATTTVAMMLEDQGRLVLDSTVGHYLPKFVEQDSAKRAITVRHLLTHQGGLEAYAPLYLDSLVRGRERYLERIAARPLQARPGTATVYSDWDMILLQLVLEQITNGPLEWFVQDHIVNPLELQETSFAPNPSFAARAAVTARDSTRGGLLQGVVHDGNAWAIGGVSGHAGLFSSARDLASFAHMMLSGGRWGDTTLIAPETIARWTAPQVDGSSRALGWDTPSGERSSAGRYFSARSFGHTGFTGTSMWMDPEKGIFVVLLTNRVHSLGTTPAGRILDLRGAVADAVMESVLDAPVVPRALPVPMPQP